MPRNPFVVLGLSPDSTMESIKTAWRRLARQHHPDIASGDPAVERRATRTMAEINAAYQELRDPEKRRVHRDAAARAAHVGGGVPSGGGTPGDGGTGGATEGASGRPGWVSRHSSVRPVTARIDTSALLRPRNATLRPLDHSPLPGLPPRPRSINGHEPPRASTPTGPTHRRRGPSMEADLPTLPEALGTRLKFGKFAGLTLGEVAAIEPSYVEWIVRTIDRDPEISLAARVVLRFLAAGPARRPRLDTFVPRG
ncbi:MAG: DnaJ domain-containing protein [Candidatus Limnocylindrales bacterium]